MSLNISPIAPVVVPGLSPLDAADSSAPSGFADVFTSAMQQVEASSQSAKVSAADLLTGGAVDIPTVALSAQKAELSFELFQQVRNKFVSAYQEIMKMQI